MRTYYLHILLNLTEKAHSFKRKLHQVFGDGSKHNIDEDSGCPLPPLDMMGLRHSKPNPIYWKHPTVTGNFYSWGTQIDSSHFFKEGYSENVERLLCQLSESYGQHDGYTK